MCPIAQIDSYSELIITGFVLPIILLSITKFVEQLQKHSFERKKEHLWKKTILRNKCIRKSFKTYKQVGSKNKYLLAYLYIGTYLGLFTPLVLFVFSLFLATKTTNTSNLTNASDLTNTSIITTSSNPNLLPFISYPVMVVLILLTIVLILSEIYKYSNTIDDSLLLKKYNKVVNLYWLIGSFMIPFLIFYVPLFLDVYSLRSSQGNVYWSLVLFIMSISVSIIILYALFLNVEDYRYKIKSHL